MNPKFKQQTSEIDGGRYFCTMTLQGVYILNPQIDSRGFNNNNVFCLIKIDDI